MLDNYKHDEPIILEYDLETDRHVHLGAGSNVEVAEQTLTIANPEIFYKRPKWYQWRLRRKLSKMPKVTDPSLAGVLRKLKK